MTDQDRGLTNSDSMDRNDIARDQQTEGRVQGAEDQEAMRTGEEPVEEGNAPEDQSEISGAGYGNHGQTEAEKR